MRFKKFTKAYIDVLVLKKSTTLATEGGKMKKERNFRSNIEQVKL